MSTLGNYIASIKAARVRLKGDPDSRRVVLYLDGPSVAHSVFRLVDEVASLFGGDRCDRADMPFGSWRFVTHTRASWCRDAIIVVYRTAGEPCPRLVVRIES